MEKSMLPESNSAPEIDMDGVPPTGSQPGGFQSNPDPWRHLHLDELINRN
jgi:hypothetical protein